MKIITCAKCGARYYGEPYDKDKVFKKLCHKCGFVWKSLGLFLEDIGKIDDLNRVIEIDLDKIVIKNTLKI